nr:MAG TPA: hypothetical protein [Caudoviricetes sp.]
MSPLRGQSPIHPLAVSSTIPLASSSLPLTVIIIARVNTYCKY